MLAVIFQGKGSLSIYNSNDCDSRKIAGVKKLSAVHLHKKDGKIGDAILVAAHLAGADEIYKVGGAQAIGAMAYSTESIPKVEKL